ncbi:MAG: MFS transporter, partial [Gammaproteobacteria bacterium]|nr:MFS transporter [Gammaproteobacteria bacterium]
AFATTVLAGFFPLFFKQFWSAQNSITDSTFQLGAGNALASLIIVMLAPLLGAIADAGQLKKRLLIVFSLLGICMTLGLYLVEQNSWLMAICFFVLASIGFSGSVVFNDALLVNVTEEKNYDKVSAYGYAMGYLGGGLLFSVNVAMVSKPEWFGFSSASDAVRFSFITVAIWWLVFSVPLWLFVHEGETREKHSVKQTMSSAITQLVNTFKKINELKMIGLFLLAYWLYIDGVDTIVRMAVDYGLAIGLEGSDLLLALLITQFVGFPAALGFGYLGARAGTKPAIMLAIAVYVAVTILAYNMTSAEEFYALAVVIGLVQGGIQSLSRSLYARIIPKSQSAEFFGFYNMLGKFAAVLGPLMIAIIAAMSDSSRLAILSVSILFVGGGILLYFVDEKKAAQLSKDYIK